MSESKAEQARREQAQRGKNKKLPFVWKVIIYASIGVLALGELVYSIGWFSVRSDTCIPTPSDLDIIIDEITTLAAFLAVLSTVGGFFHLENK